MFATRKRSKVSSNDTIIPIRRALFPLHCNGTLQLDGSDINVSFDVGFDDLLSPPSNDTFISDPSSVVAGRGEV